MGDRKTDEVQTLEILREDLISAPIDVVFETLLEQLGPSMEKPDGVGIPMKLEAWPGGRWFRDLGGEDGHFWANVQAIRRPSLLEFAGPLFMSYAAANNVQYRLFEEGETTRLKFSHRGMGLITSEHLEGAAKGWGYIADKIRENSEDKINRNKKEGTREGRI